MKHRSILLGLFFSAGLFTNAQNNTPSLQHNSSMTKDHPAAERNKVALRDLYERIINQRQLDDVGDVIAENYETDGGVHGVEGYKRTVSSVIAGFPDIHFHIEHIVAEDDLAVVHWTWKGTNTGPFRGYPVSNKPVTNEGIVIYQMKDGKAVRSWLQSDRLGALVQIGVVPKEVMAPPPVPAK
jgi:predicted ester cyclase